MRSAGASTSTALTLVLATLIVASRAFAQSADSPALSKAWVAEATTAAATASAPPAAAPAAKPPGAVLAPGSTVPSAPGTDAPDVHVMGPGDRDTAGANGSVPPPVMAVDNRPPDYAKPPPPSTTEIPQAVPFSESQGAASAPSEVPGGPDYSSNQEQPPPPPIEEQLQSLRDFVEEGDNSSPIGAVVRESHRKADGGADVTGLLVVGVLPGSPAANAGLRGYRTTTHSVLEGAVIAASLFFPPAIFAVTLVDASGVGESYDMVIGVDSLRVTNFVDFSDRLRDVQPGEIVYLNVLRDGQRVQIPVKIPPGSATGTSVAGTPR